jgi:hypothetical protein
MKMLKEHGIFYLPTTMHFNSRFYVEKVGMLEGTTFTFHSGISKAHMKGRCAKARKKGKGKTRHELMMKKTFMLTDTLK